MSSGNEGFTAPGSAVRVGPADVQQKEFRVSRLGGYKMRDVDEFLDEITTSLTTLIAENERLRSQASAPPVVGSPDLDDVSRQADEIIQRARDEAAQILADARAGTVTAAAIGGGDRGAVNAFLVQEREFLQGLAALVQGHADSVKHMAKAARTSGPAEPDPAGEPEPAADPEPPAERNEPEPQVVEAAPAAEAQDDDDRTVRIEDPLPAGTAPAEPESDGSLRELFWGEED